MLRLTVGVRLKRVKIAPGDVKANRANKFCRRSILLRQIGKIFRIIVYILPTFSTDCGAAANPLGLYTQTKNTLFFCRPPSKTRLNKRSWLHELNGYFAADHSLSGNPISPNPSQLPSKIFRSTNY